MQRHHFMRILAGCPTVAFPSSLDKVPANIVPNLILHASRLLGSTTGDGCLGFMEKSAGSKPLFFE